MKIILAFVAVLLLPGAAWAARVVEYGPKPASLEGTLDTVSIVRNNETSWVPVLKLDMPIDVKPDQHNAMNIGETSVRTVELIIDGKEMQNAIDMNRGMHAFVIGILQHADIGEGGLPITIEITKLEVR